MWPHCSPRVNTKYVLLPDLYSAQSCIRMPIVRQRSHFAPAKLPSSDDPRPEPEKSDQGNLIISKLFLKPMSGYSQLFSRLSQGCWTLRPSQRCGSRAAEFLISSLPAGQGGAASGTSYKVKAPTHFIYNLQFCMGTWLLLVRICSLPLGRIARDNF